MTDTLLFHVVIQGDSGSVYGSSIWALSVWFSPESETVYTRDSFYDTDIIGDVKTLSDALKVANDYFRHDEIIRAA